MEIRQAEPADWPAIWPIWHEVVAAGDTYAWDPASDEAAGRAAWLLPPPAEVWVALDGKTVVGTAQLRPTEFLLARAQELGYRAMQFNAVVSTNERAVGLWKSLGFEVIGTVPEGFRHARLGFVDLYVMYRRLIGPPTGSRSDKLRG